MTTPVSPPLRAAYEPEAFRATAHALMDQLADYLKAALGGGALPVLPWAPPAVN
ncbi:hypothetical protein [Corallococcus sp. RDP092CA]|uniref:hypothetical protein n=1 Tax=Corallococcus sp. RDP092CA TaxID=3109369 RepID=UPI0035B3EEB1